MVGGLLLLLLFELLVGDGDGGGMYVAPRLWFTILDGSRPGGIKDLAAGSGNVEVASGPLLA